jgi:hypothetical protein
MEKYMKRVEKIIGGSKPVKWLADDDAKFKAALEKARMERANMGFFDRLEGVLASRIRYAMIPAAPAVAAFLIIVIIIACGGAYLYSKSTAGLVSVSREGVIMVKGEATDINKEDVIRMSDVELVKVIEDITGRLAQGKEMTDRVKKELEKTRNRWVAEAMKNPHKKEYLYLNKSMIGTGEEAIKAASEKAFPQQPGKIAPMTSGMPMTISSANMPATATGPANIRTMAQIDKDGTYLYQHYNSITSAREIYPDIAAMLLREKIHGKILSSSIIEVRKDGSVKRITLVHDVVNKRFILEGFEPISESGVSEAVSEDDAILEETFSYLDEDEINTLRKLNAGSDVLLSKAQDKANSLNR